MPQTKNGDWRNLPKHTFTWQIPFKVKPIVFVTRGMSNTNWASGANGADALQPEVGISYKHQTNQVCYYYVGINHSQTNGDRSVISFLEIGRWK